jgi:membrane-associated phospholipid phosphatase
MPASLPPSRPRLALRANSATGVVATLAVTGVILFVAGIVLGLLLVGRHGGGPVQSWDRTVWHWSIHHRGPLVATDKAIATLGDAALLGPLCVLLSVVMFVVHRSPRALSPLLAYLGGEGLVFLIRTVIHRDRPPTANYPAPAALPGVHETSFSFPSGHSVTVTAVLFGLLGLLALSSHRWWPWLLAFAGSAFVADSRLLLGVHWFSDVAVGVLLGIGWGVAIALICHNLTWADLHLSRGAPRGETRR